MVEKIKDRRSPGEIYSGISVEARDFGVDDSRLIKRKDNKFVAFCRNIYRRFPGLGANSKYDPEFQTAMDFLDWDLRSEEYTAATKFVLIAGLILTAIIAFILFMYAVGPMISLFGNAIMPYIIAIGVPAIAFIYAFITFRNYPLTKVRDEKIKALTFVPEILGYMIMSMKLVPNLEKAVEFASNHGHGKIADDLKRLLWEVKVGIKGSVAEALDQLAYKWGDVSVELKKALMKIRSSVIETSESKRYAILDQTMTDTLASIKNKLEDYARGLNQPTMTMFYLGVLLPLLLIIVLPVGSAFSGSALAKPIYLILIYNIAIPFACIMFARNIIRGRPATYNPPDIPQNHPDLPPRYTIKIGKAPINVFILMVILGVAIIAGSIFLQGTLGKTKENVLLKEGYIQPGQDISLAKFNCNSQEVAQKGIDPKFMCASEREFWQDSAHDVTPYFLIYGMLIGFSLILSLFLFSESYYKRKVQIETEKMEDEFKDALYVIASRLGENKPIEDAFAHTRAFLPKSLIAKNVFGKAIDNIRILGLNLNSSLFDPNYGALKNNPSNIINSAMRLMVDSVQLGVSVAAKTLMSYSMQLRNSDEVSKMLTNLISSVTGTLSSMAKYIAPIVLGITTALQKIVISTLTSIANSGTLDEMNNAFDSFKTSGISTGGMDVSGISSIGSIDMATVNQLAGPTTFLIIVAIYVIEIVIIMTFFTTMVEQDNITLAKLRIAQTLPIAIILFILTTIASNLIF